MTCRKKETKMQQKWLNTPTVRPIISCHLLRLLRAEERQLLLISHQTTAEHHCRNHTDETRGHELSTLSPSHAHHAAEEQSGAQLEQGLRWILGSVVGADTQHCSECDTGRQRGNRT